jgi:hypothetical protein
LPAFLNRAISEITVASPFLQLDKVQGQVHVCFWPQNLSPFILSQFRERKDLAVNQVYLLLNQNGQFLVQVKHVNAVVLVNLVVCSCQVMVVLVNLVVCSCQSSSRIRSPPSSSDCTWMYIDVLWFVRSTLPHGTKIWTKQRWQTKIITRLLTKVCPCNLNGFVMFYDDFSDYKCHTYYYGRTIIIISEQISLLL